MDWKALLIAALAGGGTGFLGTIIAPWSNWGIEVSRERRKARQKLLESCYKMIAKYQVEDIDLLVHPSYIAIREYLRPESLKELEQRKFNVINVRVGVKGVAANQESKILLEELSRLKKRWHL